MISIFTLTIIFANGYMGGSVRAHDFKTMAECQKFGPQIALQYTANGHPGSFVCSKQSRVKVLPKPEVHEVQTLPAG
jgi:hypothetical protein